VVVALIQDSSVALSSTVTSTMIPTSWRPWQLYPLTYASKY